jgi:type I restriction enzyme M protein
MFEQTFKNIDDVLWKEVGCTTELDYTEQTSWLLFLKYLDDLEQERATSPDTIIWVMRGARGASITRRVR